MKLLLVLSKTACQRLHHLAKKIDVGFVGSMAEYYTEDTTQPMLLQTQNIQQFLPTFNNLKHIPLAFHQKLQKSQVHYGDILLARSGSFGNAAIFLANSIANSSDIIIIEPNDEQINRFFLLAFFNSKFGRNQILRFASGGLQGHVNLTILENLLVPKFSPTFQKNIETIILQAYCKNKASENNYKQTENILLRELGLSDWRPTEESVTTKTFADFQNSGRLDAEYYQPKYDEIERKISSYKNGTISCSEILVNAMTKLNPGFEYCYLELADIGKSGEIVSCTKDVAENLPSRARQNVRANDVIVSSVEGSLPSCALITEDYNNAICSTGFHVMRSSKINPETLLLLMKSAPIQALLKKGCSGTILTAILPDALKHIELPLVRQEIQTEIAAKIQESFALRKESKRLLDLAKHAVEVAIEQGEDAAMSFLTRELHVDSLYR